ncbi:MAG: type II toxin-antitoxin system RelE/ParE family toxin, partial [Achromobacter sp.]|nr:type II toxin-antitoxin system RelE/ParE family toxin [Achromobacter sp.]
MKIEVTSAAERHLHAARRFYEQQSPGLGDYFLDSLMADIESLHIYAGTHAVYFERYHRLLAKRFPYSVYYRVENDTIRVYAVMDNRRNPEQIRKRL